MELLARCDNSLSIGLGNPALKCVIGHRKAQRQNWSGNPEKSEFPAVTLNSILHDTEQESDRADEQRKQERSVNRNVSG
jgi:hypothetical protein